MRYRLMASYDGSPFEAGVGPTKDDVVLFAACPPPEDLGFEPATGHWRKHVRFADTQAVWESRPVGVFRGERCLVLDDLGDRLHIGYLGHDAVKAGQLGYWQVDRGVFELIAPRTEVTDILEERVDVPRPGGLAAAADPQETPANPRPTAALAGGDPAPAGHGREAGHPSGPIEPRTPVPTPAAGHPSGPIEPRTPVPAPAAGPSPASVPVPDARTGVSLPAPPADPLPLEAAAMRAASASRLREEPGSRVTGAALLAAAPPQPQAARLGPVPASPPLAPVPSPEPDAARPATSHRVARRRKDAGQLLADLASLAGIAADSYSVGEEAEGALCLVETEDGFEVFLAADGARHEVQAFATEEAACFYLFGVLAAEAVRTGTLTSVPGDEQGWRSQTA